jgi:hypothetical protein
MSYTITKTSGANITVNDGTIDNTTDLTLIGKNYPGYGALLNQNFVRLLENFSYSTAPTKKITGQLWFDSTNKALNVWDGSNWKGLQGVSSSASSPSGPVAGDLWWDTTNTLLKAYDTLTSAWVTIGPSGGSALLGTNGASAVSVNDTLAASHVIVRFYVGSSIVAIFSKDSEFTPASTITGFPVIRPGLNLASTGAISGISMNGSANNATYFGNLSTTDFIRANANATTSGTFSVLNNTGLRVGASSDFGVSVSSGTITVSNNTSNGNLNLQVNKGGTVTNALIIDGTTGNVYANTSPAAGGLGTQVATKSYVDSATGSVATSLQIDGSNYISGNIRPNVDNVWSFGTSSYRFNIIYGNTAGIHTGNVTGEVTGNLTGTTASIASITKSGTDGVGNIGQTGNKFNTIFATTFSGTSSQATYADLAERFEADAHYEPGTVVALGGVKEITKVAEELSEDVFGVVSTNAAYLMNSGAGSDATHPPIAVSGRVPVQVTGKVKKGDRLVSAGDGLARAASRSEMTSFNVIGRALSAKTTDGVGTVEAIVKLNS